MTVKIFTIPVFLLAFIFLYCSNIKTQQAVSNNHLSDFKRKGANGEPISYNHNSKNALDPKGAYRGVLPCADCDGLETTIELKDSTYVMKIKYLGKSDKTILKIGSFTWNNTGTIITFNNIFNAPNQFEVGENSLTQLDMEGKKIAGKHATKYVLEKVIIQQLDNKGAENKQLLFTSTKWELIILMGKPVQSFSKDNMFYLQFFNDSSIAAFVGCNGIGGKYLLRDFNKISFTNLQSTLKACSDMEAEKQLTEALQKTDNYSIKGNKLSLNKARMAPLAVFTKIE